MRKSGIFYGWFIVWAGFFIGFFGIGSRYSYGVFLKSIEADFGLTRTASSGIFSLYMLLSCLVAVAGGWALDRYGPRKVGLLMATFTGLSLILTSQAQEPWHLMITYSLILSAGTGAIYGTVNVTTSRWFVAKRGLGVGLSSSGGGVGAILIAPLAAFFVSHFEWRTGFILIGAICWAGMAGASLMLIKDPRDVGLLPDGIKRAPLPQGNPVKESPAGPAGLTLGQAGRMVQFWLLGFAWLFLSLSLHTMFIHLVPNALDMGISPMNAALILSMIGLANTPGRLVLGRLSDRLETKMLSVVCLLAQAGTVALFIWAGTLWMLYGSGLAFGFLWGASGTLTTVLTAEIFGTRSLGMIMGMMSALWAIGAAVGPALGGYLFDISGQYTLAFAAGVASLLAAALLVALIRKPKTP